MFGAMDSLPARSAMVGGDFDDAIVGSGAEVEAVHGHAE
jgi:hypothetical protein